VATAEEPFDQTSVSKVAYAFDKRRGIRFRGR
jgi:hypothetical protein